MNDEANAVHEAYLARVALVDALVERAMDENDWYSGSHADDAERLSDSGRS